MPEPTLTYFISDTHLGASHLDNPLKREQKVVRFLQQIAPTAKQIYLLGDILDYWFEYRTVVPRGHTRLLGTLALMADSGIKITWITGNHDAWISDYIPQELGITVAKGPITAQINGQNFLLAHGDEIGHRPATYRLLRAAFHSPMLRKLFATIHPRWTVAMAHRWSASSRGSYRQQPNQNPYLDWAKHYTQTHPQTNYIILGHQHQLLRQTIAPHTQLIIIGDWITHDSYAVFDGKTLTLNQYRPQ